MSFHHILSDLVSNFGKGPIFILIFYIYLFSELAKFLQPTLESSSIQTTEKWEAMIFHHILLDLVSDFLKGSKMGLKKLVFYLFSAMGESNWMQ